MELVIDRRAWQRARESRDARFDGRFFIGVLTTGIYCRPICPAKTAREANVRYFRSGAAAAEAGFRPCLRCRPEVAPGTPAWNGTSTTVRRAWRLIDDAVAGDLSIEKLAEQLGVGTRHLRRLFLQHLGAAPLAVLQTRRLHFAKQLIDGTAMPFTEVALASGFGSIRRFNAAFRKTWDRTPSALRRLALGQQAVPGAARFRLGYRPPYDWDAMLSFLQRRTVPGLEAVDSGHYRRTVVSRGKPGTIDISDDAAGCALIVNIDHPDPQAVYTILRRVRLMFDVDADPDFINRHLALDSLLRGRIRRRPGVRVPGAWDPFELAVRAIVGQQASVAGALTLVRRVTETFGVGVASGDDTLGWTFPEPAALADAPLERVGLTRARAMAVRTLATSVATGELTFDDDHNPAAVVARLQELPGIGPWTAQYIAMRALSDPDAFPLGDLGLRRAANLTDRALSDRAEQWRPWRAYAAMHLWMEADHVDRHSIHRGAQPRRTAVARARRERASRVAVRQRPTAG
jgi:AraC family transcriptional regulator, regulatory protein of adaptative response / DNA-3-methyladenine glycosylase II